ncbi:MAG: hypothetical protein LBI29_03895 [Rickettsiales bacterium]|nr:hypothetical protein [Rickettsiales bacterium]
MDEDDELEFPPLAEGRGRVGMGIEVEGFLDYQSDYQRVFCFEFFLQYLYLSELSLFYC